MLTVTTKGGALEVLDPEFRPTDEELRRFFEQFRNKGDDDDGS